MLVVKENESDSFIPWNEFKKKLKPLTDKESQLLLKNSQFSSQEILLLHTKRKDKSRSLTTSEYQELLNAGQQSRSEIAEARAEMAQLKREASWLINCAFSVVGLAAFSYFAASFRFDRTETRLIIAMLSGLIVFFIEVIIYIIILNE